METKRAPKIPGWDIFEPLPGLENSLPKLEEAYLPLAPTHFETKSDLHDLLVKSGDCRSVEWLPITSGYMWPLAAIYRVPNSGANKNLFLIYAQGDTPTLEHPLAVYTQAGVEIDKLDVNTVLNNLAAFFKKNSENKI